MTEPYRSRDRAVGKVKPAEYDPNEHYHWEEPDEVWGFYAKPDSFSDYEYGVLDGDTWDLLVDQGFRDYQRPRIRAVHIDAAEVFSARRGSAEYRAGIEQRDFARDWMADAVDAHDGDWPLVLRTRRKRGSFDRWLGEVFDRDGNSLERALIDEFDDDPFFRWGDLY